MKITLTIIIFCVSLITQAVADNKSEINMINTIVANIEKTKAELNVLELRLQTGEFEASPPEVKYYYKPENMQLVALQVSTGHETFVIQYSYYYNDNKLIKYLKERLHKPDSSTKQAIIYNKGKILWKNIDEPVYDNSKAIELFQLNMQALKSFSKY